MKAMLVDTTEMKILDWNHCASAQVVGVASAIDRMLAIDMQKLGHLGPDAVTRAAVERSALKFFGTDGLRARTTAAHYRPNESLAAFMLGRELSPMFCYLAARAFFAMMKEHDGIETFACGIAEDGREAVSRVGLFNALCSAAHDEGITVTNLGVVPTPAVAAWSLDHGCCAIMMTASHNPAPFNGLKFFIEGSKLSRAGVCGEYELSARMIALATALGDDFSLASPVVPEEDSTALDLLSTLAASVISAGQRANLQHAGLTIDCAHGAVGKWVHVLLTSLALSADVLHSQISKNMINNGCGAAHDGTSPLLDHLLLRQRREGRSQYGIAVDGDGDRCKVFHLPAGGTSPIALNGDDLLLVLLPHLRSVSDHREVRISIESDPALAAVVRLRFPDLSLSVSAVGDRYLSSGREQTLLCGSEESGHIVFPVKVGKRFLYSGNGLLTGLLAVAELEKGISYPLFVRKGKRMVVAQDCDTGAWYEHSALFAAVEALVASVFGSRAVRVAIEEDRDILMYAIDGDETLYARASGTEAKIQLVCPPIGSDYDRVSEGFIHLCEPYRL